MSWNKGVSEIMAVLHFKQEGGGRGELKYDSITAGWQNMTVDDNRGDGGDPLRRPKISMT